MHDIDYNIIQCQKINVELQFFLLSAFPGPISNGV